MGIELGNYVIKKVYCLGDLGTDADALNPEYSLGNGRWAAAEIDIDIDSLPFSEVTQFVSATDVAPTTN